MYLSLLVPLLRGCGFLRGPSLTQLLIVRIPPALTIKLSFFLPLIAAVSDQTELLMRPHAAPPHGKITPHPRRESTYPKSQLPFTQVQSSQQLRTYRTLTREAT